VLAPYLLGATDAAREIYSSWARDLSSAGDLSSTRSFAKASRREDARRSTSFFFAGNLLLADKVAIYLATLLPYHLTTLLPCHLATLLPCYLATLRPY
jgi:hypothetical protein